MLHPHPPFPSPATSGSYPSSSSPLQAPRLPPSSSPRINSPLTLPAVATAMEAGKVITDLATAVTVSTLAVGDAAPPDLEVGNLEGGEPEVADAQAVEDVAHRTPPPPTSPSDSPSSAPLPLPEDDNTSGQSKRLSFGSGVMASPASSRHSAAHTDKALMPMVSEGAASPPPAVPSPAEEVAATSPPGCQESLLASEEATIAELDKAEAQAAQMAADAPSCDENEGDTAEALAVTESTVSEGPQPASDADEDGLMTKVADNESKQMQVDLNDLDYPFNASSKSMEFVHPSPQPSFTEAEHIQTKTINPAVLRPALPPSTNPSSSSSRQTESEPEGENDTDQTPRVGKGPASSNPVEEDSDADGEFEEDDQFARGLEENEVHLKETADAKAISAVLDLDEAIDEAVALELDEIENQKVIKELEDEPMVVSDSDEPSIPYVPARGRHHRQRVGALRGSSPDDIVYVGKAAGPSTPHLPFGVLSGKRLPAAASPAAPTKPPPYKPLIRAKNKFTPPSRRSDRVLARSPASNSSLPASPAMTTNSGPIKITVPKVSKQSAIPSSRATSATSSKKRALESDDEEDIMTRVYKRINDGSRSPSTPKRRSTSGFQPKVKRGRQSTERSGSPDPRFQKPAKMLAKSDGKRRGTGTWPKLPKEAAASLMMGDLALDKGWICPDCCELVTNNNIDMMLPAPRSRCIRGDCWRRLVTPVRTLADKPAASREVGAVGTANGRRHRKMQDVNPDTDTWYCERVIGRRAVGRYEGSSTRAFEYLVKWQDWAVADSTWEPKENLAHINGRCPMIETFEKKAKEEKEPLKQKTALLAEAFGWFDRKTGKCLVEPSGKPQPKKKATK
ncbi:uncharacterized protein LOC62_07G009350 [Vanrija pseudolonga]|uniref:Chromo domain-containing protein n=1 Tax=Vanrija pseudolonga TaxID=143232 RepID=A0AAF0YHR0_9TREE|nr:hypothetical protein LOC62_07G009350 [Vanrija pseudolonga]